MKRIGKLAIGALSAGLVPCVEALAETRTLQQVLLEQLAIAEKRIVGAADAMPEAAYGFVPGPGEFKDVRAFRDQIKHAAAVNYLIFGGLRGEKPPSHANEGKGPDDLVSKAEILRYLRDSYGYAREALASFEEAKMLEVVEPGPFTRLGLAILGPIHALDHYGQVVVYLRMNGVVPPVTQEQIREQQAARQPKGGE